MIHPVGGQAVRKTNMALFGELKRRHVIRVLVAYAIAGWVAVEVADVMFPRLGLPEWAVNAITWSYVGGFLPVAILAWIFKWTPEGLKRDLGLAGPQAPERSIAVLPFANMSADVEQEYFADGLAEELLNLLARVPDLQVAARTSAFAFKGKDMPVREIAQALHVAQVLEGSVRKSGDQVRITAQLIHASDGYHMWSETWDRTLEDIFAVQDEIAHAVLKKLKMDIAPAEKPTTRPMDTEAYNLVLLGRYLVEQRTRPSVKKAIAALSQAVKLAPDHADGWTMLARAIWQEASGGWIHGAQHREAMRASREALDRALSADPDSPEAYEFLGWLTWSYDWDWSTADHAIRRSLQVKPDNPRALNTAACLALTLGRLDESLEIFGRALGLDPLNTPVLNNLALAYLYADRFDEAESAIKRAIAILPDAAVHRYILGRIYLAMGDLVKARRAFEDEVDEEARESGEVLLLTAEGHPDKADQMLDKMMVLDATPALDIASVYAMSEDADQAFQWLELAREQRDGNLCDIRHLPEFRNLHSDSRWNDFLGTIGLSDHQIADLALKPFPLD
jgi:TolB-like protein/Tfp pilus assembly protein PilF